MMNSSNSATASSAAGRRRGLSSKQYSVEEQALDQIAKEAETRLAAKRAARAEAREIRMKEIERQQKEEEKQEKDGGSDSSSTRLQGDYNNSRRSSFDSTDSMETHKDVSKELKSQLRDLETKFKDAMMTNAQLDNEKHTLMYQVELLKDKMEEQEEGYTDLQREFKEKSRVLELKLRDLKNMESELTGLKALLAERENLIKESGMVVVSTEEGSSLEKSDVPTNGPVLSSGSVLLSQDVADMLEKSGEGSLDEKLKKFATERLKLIQEVKRLKEELDDENIKETTHHLIYLISTVQKCNFMKFRWCLTVTVVFDSDSGVLQRQLCLTETVVFDSDREASKQIHEYKLKLQKAEQDIATLEGTVNRLETQVKRYRTDAEDSERLEDELKTEKRRLQRELREAQNHTEELQNSNKHLQKDWKK
ncbi:hypothetical protein ScPMuIL_015269 [Solemya velum]